MQLLAISGLIASSLVFPAQAQAEPMDVICQAEGVIVGTEDDETITGTAGDDIICSLGGDDEIDGLGGNDHIISGDGNDTVIGGTGEDLIELGAGNDTAEGGEGDDYIEAGPGDDYSAGGPGADMLFGSAGADQLLGVEGDDGLDGGEGVDRLAGGEGSDTCVKATGDIYESCFYDTKGPTLINAAIDPAQKTVDTSQQAVTVRVRFTVRDLGSGPSTAIACFAYRPSYESCDYEFWINPNWAIHKNPYTYVVEVAITLPHNSGKSTIYFVGFDARDKAMNRTIWDYAKLKSKGLAISFKQVGSRDATAPVLKKIDYPEKAIFDSATQEIPVDVTYQTDGRDSFHWEVIYDARFSFGGSLDFSQPEATYLESAGCVVTLRHGCVTSGDRTSGTARFLVNLNLPWQSISKIFAYSVGTANATRVYARDQFGNTRTYAPSSSLKAKLAVRKNFFVERPPTQKPVKDSDRTAPKITDLDLSRTVIDTAADTQTVDVTVQAQDVGIGFATTLEEYGWHQLQVSFAIPGLLNGEEQDLPCTFNRVVSKGLKATMTTTCTWPAHIRAGKYPLRVWIFDSSTQRNWREYSPSALKKMGLPYQVVNGN